MSKKKQVHFFLTEEEHESLKDRAWTERLSISDFIRYCLKCQDVDIEELIKDKR